jgi:hypothetical protein
MKLYCGIDLHANNRVVSITAEKDDVHYEKSSAKRLGCHRTSLSPFQANLQGCVVESTYN